MNQLEKTETYQSSNSIPGSRPPSVQQKDRKSGSKLGSFLLIVVLFAGALAGVYYWQNTKTKDINVELNSVKSELRAAQQSKEKEITDKPQQAIVPEVDKVNTANLGDGLIAGQAETNRSDGRILVTAVYKLTNLPEEIWIDYGENPEQLDKSTSHATKALGLGDPSATYSFGQSLEIPKSSVKAGTSYFYRVSAKINGQTAHGSLASFTTIK